ncbi:MAG: DPP IV N-terminal domain-containing protein [Gemmatimonadaceae bacterium]|nr:DPP IV N-terminal domain-containing protein [Gemmatimonadaceae bacterium]
MHIRPAGDAFTFVRASLAALVAALLFAATPSQLAAQSLSARYARADAFLPWNAQSLVSGNTIDPHWLDGDRFWFRASRGLGGEFIVVDPVRGTRATAFDHVRLAAALSLAADTAYAAGKLPFTEFEYVRNGQAIRFNVADSARFTCDIVAYTCAAREKAAAPAKDEILSPDGKWAAFSRNENLWVRNVASGEETQLSTDGEANWGYGVVPEGCCQEITNRRAKRKVWPVLRWSPDSRRIATHRYDERRVELLNLIETVPGGRPKLHSYHYALPGDSVIPTWEAYVFDVEARRGVKLEIAPIPGFFTSADSSFDDVQWTRDGASLFVTARSRDFKKYDVWQGDPASGKARLVFTDSGKTYRELNQFGAPNWRPLKNGKELLWWSERDGWGHLYRIDVATGKVINQVTSGAWLVLDLLSVDETLGTVHFAGVGREGGVDPYYRLFYKVALDGSGLARLTPENADHAVTVTPSGKYFVDLYSRRDLAPTGVLRAADGRVLQGIEKGDIAPLAAVGWKPPVPFTAKGRDGVTDVYGYLYFPSDYDSTKSYPVLDYIYPGPQIGAVATRSFVASAAGFTQSMAELGFIVFTVDAFGSPVRSKAFHDAYYANMTDNGIPDHISAIKALGVRYRAMDLDRVGIYGHSGGGFSGTDAILRYPDFYKVAVSGAGNHDQRVYHFPWGEKYHGLLVKNQTGGSNYDSQANQSLAANLKGKLLLSYGTLDDNVHPDMTLAVIDALIRANKKFDVFVFPNRNHGYAIEPYAIQLTMDYFVRHLRREEPPADYVFRMPR